jgi:hypothetical protein
LSWDWRCLSTTSQEVLAKGCAVGSAYIEPQFLLRHSQERFTSPEIQLHRSMSLACERKIRGDALTTAFQPRWSSLSRSAKSTTEGSSPSRASARRKLVRSSPATWGCFFLRDLATLVPVDGSRERHIVGEFIRRTPKRRKNVLI